MNLLNDDLNSFEYFRKLELEYNKKSLKSKPLTKDFIEKIDKCRSIDELEIVYKEIKLNFKNMIADDKTFLFNLYVEKQEKILEKSKTLTKDFIKKIDKCKTNEKLDVVYNEIISKFQDFTDEDIRTLIVLINKKEK